MIEYLQGQRREPSLFSPPFGALVTPRDILTRNPASAIGTYDADALQALTTMARYVSEFLTSGHPELGRAGAVCPFAAKAMEEDLIRLTAFSLAEPDEAAVAAGMERLRGELAALEAGLPSGAAPRHRAIVAVFPRLSQQTGAALVERVQKALKPAFIARELMIGQFYPGCPEPGLWNAGFRPLQTPVVSLAIRNITIFDAPFMLERQAYVDAFVRVFGEAGEQRIVKARRDRRQSAADPSAADRSAACPHASGAKA